MGGVAAGGGGSRGRGFEGAGRPAGRARAPNKGFARRPQRLPGWGEWEQEVVEVVGAGGVDMRECMWE